MVLVRYTCICLLKHTVLWRCYFGAVRMKSVTHVFLLLLFLPERLHWPRYMQTTEMDAWQQWICCEYMKVVWDAVTGLSEITLLLFWIWSIQSWILQVTQQNSYWLATKRRMQIRWLYFWHLSADYIISCETQLNKVNQGWKEYRIFESSKSVKDKVQYRHCEGYNDIRPHKLNKMPF